MLAAALALSQAAYAKDEAGKGNKPEKAAKADKGGPPKPAAAAKAHAGPHAGHAEGAAAGSEKGKGPAGQGRAEAAKEEAAERAEQREERRAERAELKGKLTELRERHAQGKLSKDELKKELAALRESRKERRQGRQAALHERWGNKLAEPSAQQELRHHERRMAQLERMALLAQTERSGAAKDALMARIEKLTARENERHERKMSQLGAQAGNTKPASAVEPPKEGAAAPANPEKQAEKTATKKEGTP